MNRLAVAVLLAFNIGLQATAVQAGPFVRHAGEQRSALYLAANGFTLEQAAAKVRKQSRGKLLSAEEQQRDNGGRVYRIKVLKPGGIVKVIYIDPVSGARIRP